MSRTTKIIIGLGNPGAKYAASRHNMGYMAIDRLADRLGIRFNKSGHQAVYGQGDIDGVRVLLVKPETYMNESGRSVGSFMRYYKPGMQNLLVMYDDIDLPCGSVRMRLSGSAGTHNGMRSVILHLEQKQAFPRIRIGVGRPEPGEDLIHFVLNSPKPEQKESISDALDRAAESAEVWIRNGGEAAMQTANKKDKP